MLHWGKIMIRPGMIVVLGVFAFVVCGYQPASAGCQVISATHSADTKGEALKMSQALAAESANDLRRSKGWKIDQRERLQGETRSILEGGAAGGA
jgi:hypothetical protein